MAGCRGEAGQGLPRAAGRVGGRRWRPAAGAVVPTHPSNRHTRVSSGGCNARPPTHLGHVLGGEGQRGQRALQRVARGAAGGVAAQRALHHGGGAQGAVGGAGQRVAPARRHGQAAPGQRVCGIRGGGRGGKGEGVSAAAVWPSCGMAQQPAAVPNCLQLTCTLSRLHQRSMACSAPAELCSSFTLSSLAAGLGDHERGLVSWLSSATASGPRGEPGWLSPAAARGVGGRQAARWLGPSRIAAGRRRGTAGAPAARQPPTAAEAQLPHLPFCCAAGQCSTSGCKQWAAPCGRAGRQRATRQHKRTCRHRWLAQLLHAVGKEAHAAPAGAALLAQLREAGARGAGGAQFRRVLCELGSKC